MDKVFIYSFLLYGLLTLMAVGFVWFIVASTWGSRGSFVTAEDVKEGKLVPSKNIERMTGKWRDLLNEHSYQNENGITFRKNLGRVLIDRSLFGYSIVVEGGTHIVVEGTISCKHLAAGRVIEAGKGWTDWRWYPKHGIAEAHEVNVG